MSNFSSEISLSSQDRISDMPLAAADQIEDVPPDYQNVFNEGEEERELGVGREIAPLSTELDPSFVDRSTLHHKRFHVWNSGYHVSSDMSLLNCNLEYT